MDALLMSHPFPAQPDAVSVRFSGIGGEQELHVLFGGGELDAAAQAA
jgi:hypothetical protein